MQIAKLAQLCAERAMQDRILPSVPELFLELDQVAYDKRANEPRVTLT